MQQWFHPENTECEIRNLRGTRMNLIRCPVSTEIPRSKLLPLNEAGTRVSLRSENVRRMRFVY